MKIDNKGFNLKLLVLAIIAGSIISKVEAQVDSCNCTANYNDLVKKVEENYIAFHLTIKNKPGELKKYEAFKQRMQKESLKTTSADCMDLLGQFVAYFHDLHLFVYEDPKYSTEELNQFRSQIQHYPLTEAAAKKYFDKERIKLDPIEGIWNAQQSAYKLAVIRNPQKTGEFLAVVLESINPSWKPGDVKGIMHKTEKGYETVYYFGNFSRTKFVAKVFKNVIINAGPVQRWGRIYPEEYLEQPFLNTIDAALPTVKKIDNANVLLSIPTFLVEGDYLDSLLKSHQDEIRNTKNLLIDLRGNTGGNAIYFSLINYYYTKLIGDEQGLALSSPTSIAYFKRSSSYIKKKPGDTALNLYERVVKDMEDNPGKIVKGPLWPLYRIDTSKGISENPKRVAILTDRVCASAAESFILHSRRSSDRVITFGEATSGTIDYTSTTQMPMLCSKGGYWFGYPTSTFHSRIPNDGYNKTGIIPAVKIENSVKDKIGFIIKWLNKN